MNQRACPPTQAEELVIQHAVDKAVKQTFAILGVDVDSPESVEEFREDLRFGKRLRKMANHGQLAMVGIIVLGLCWATWDGIHSKFTGH